MFIKISILLYLISFIAFSKNLSAIQDEYFKKVLNISKINCSKYIIEKNYKELKLELSDLNDDLMFLLTDKNIDVSQCREINFLTCPFDAKFCKSFY